LAFKKILLGGCDSNSDNDNVYRDNSNSKKDDGQM